MKDYFIPVPLDIPAELHWEHQQKNQLSFSPTLKHTEFFFYEAGLLCSALCHMWGNWWGLTYSRNWCLLRFVSWKVKGRVAHFRTYLFSEPINTEANMQTLAQLSFIFNNSTEREGFHNKHGHLERFWIRLIRFVFCLLFRRHDQSDISPICVSSGGEEEEFGECCLLISSGSVHCALGTVIKTKELWIMKSVDQKWNKTEHLCFISGLLATGLGCVF